MKKKTSEVEWRTDLNDTQQKIIKLLSEDHQLSAVKLAEKIGVVRRNIENRIWYSHRTWFSKEWLLGDYR